MIIILDTNFLIYLVKHRIADKLKDFGGSLVVPETVEKELEKPSFGPEDRAFASAALELLRKWKVSVVPTELKNTDKSLLELAKEFKEAGEEIYVATMDGELSFKLKRLGAGLIKVKRGKILSKE